MALAPRDIPVTREMVRSWITGWKLSIAGGGTATLREWIIAKIDALGLTDVMVDTSGMDHVAGDEMHVGRYIFMDMRSYDNAP